MDSGGILGFLTGAGDSATLMFILFDNPLKSYYVGQNVSGRLVVRLKKPKKFRNIAVIIKGEACVRWSETSIDNDSEGNSTTSIETYTGNEKYFEDTVIVAGSRISEDNELQPGEYSYPFNFVLPSNIPTSFEGSHGYIRYTVKGIIRCPTKFDHDCKTAFTVVSSLDLNSIPSVKEPVLQQESQTIYCLFCKSGPLELSVELPCSGYVPGQTIPFKVDIDNGSRVTIYPVNCVLYKKVSFTATCSRTKIEKMVIAKIAVDEMVDPYSNKTISQDFKIPPIPPSHLKHCSIIHIEYYFQVEACVSDFHRNLKVHIPVTLGTIPLLTGSTKFVAPPPIAPLPSARPHEAPNEPQPAGHTGPSTASSAPPAYPDLHIDIKFKGEANVRWTEHKRRTSSRRSTTRTYRAKENYFENTVTVAGGADEDTELQPGEYSYPFNFILPTNIPTSFEGSHGSIRYTVKGIIRRPWRFDHDCKTAFTVVSSLDLNTISSVKEPVLQQESKKFCCLFCKSGPLELSVELPCSGYVPGQTIPFKVDIDNGSRVTINPVNCVLYKKVSFTSSSPRTKTKIEKKVIAEIAVDEIVDPYSNKTITQDFKIPSIPPSYLEHCSIIHIEYYFKVEACVSDFHRNLKVHIPVTLGTIPLLTGPTKFVAPPPIAPLPSAPPDEGNAPNEPQPAGHTDPSTAPSAPPAYPDLPPPSYEECMFGGQNIMDASDGEHTMGLTDFIPRYPVWNFDQQK